VRSIWDGRMEPVDGEEKKPLPIMANPRINNPRVTWNNTLMYLTGIQYLRIAN